MTVHRTFDSSRVARADYDAEKLELIVEFVDGTLWRYTGVPLRVWKRMIRAGSVGRFVTDSLDQYENGAYTRPKKR